MKLATLRNGTADGTLLVVSRDRSRAVTARTVVPTMQAAVERWVDVEVPLRQLADALEAGGVSGEIVLDHRELAAPLPRAWQWLDASAFPSHGELMQRAFDLPPVKAERPLMYQGMSDTFLSWCEDVPFVSEADGIDFEGEYGVVTDHVPMGATVAEALGRIRLLVQINDWSLRAIAPEEMKTGFGWVQAKPACSMAPIAITPDELGPAWSRARIDLALRCELNGEPFGDVPGAEGMVHGFDELVAHAARTRSLVAGTVIGSGTVSSSRYASHGSCCVSERRAIEMIETDAARTPFLRFGDRVRMVAAGDPFGAIDQCVRRWNA